MAQNSNKQLKSLLASRLEKSSALSAFCFSALLNGLLFTLVLTLGTPGYEANDDLTMQLLASGFFTGEPSEYLVFTHVIIGGVLKVLYHLWNVPNWYLGYLVAVQYVSFTSIAFVFLGRGLRWTSVLLYLVLFYLAGPTILLKLQFTRTAFTAGAAGVLLLVDGLVSSQPVAIGRVVGGIFLVCLAAMIRDSVVPLLAILAWPFLWERFGLENWRRAALTAIILAGCMLSLIGINRWCYQRDPGWAMFHEFNALRGRIHATPLERFIPTAASKAGWTVNDGEMFCESYFPDPNVYLPPSKLRALSEQLQTLSQREPSSRRISVACIFLPTLFERDSSDLMSFAFLNAAACVCLAGRGRRWRCACLVMATYLMCVLVGLYLYINVRLPDRVSFAMAFFLNVVCLYWVTSVASAPSPSLTKAIFVDLHTSLGRSKALLIGAATCFAIWSVLYLSLAAAEVQDWRNINSSNRGARLASAAFLHEAQTGFSGGRPILIPLPPESSVVWSLFYYPTTQNLFFTVMPYGWLTHSPVYYTFLKQHGLDPDPASLVDRPDVIFVMRNDRTKRLQTYYREHKGWNVNLDLVLNTNLETHSQTALRFYAAHTVSRSNTVAEPKP